MATDERPMSGDEYDRLTVIVQDQCRRAAYTTGSADNARGDFCTPTTTYKAHEWIRETTALQHLENIRRQAPRLVREEHRKGERER